MGSSPLTRGKLPLDPPPVRMGGLIPAHAGKTRLSPIHRMGSPAHPRSRGENNPLVYTGATLSGSSPLTRGKPVPVRSHHRSRGLIPAHAGKTLPDMRFYCADRSDLGNP